MLDLGTQLRDYLDATAPAVELEDVVAAPVGDSSVRPIRVRSTVRPIQAWVSAAAAAIVILLLVGGMAWLLSSDQPEEPVSSTTVVPTTVAPTTVVPTTAPLPGSTTTLPAVPIVLEGDGPTLTFVEGESPATAASEFEVTSGIRLGDGVWFAGALYALDGNDSLYRSSDGLSWDLVSGWQGVQNGSISLQADDDRLMSIMSLDIDSDFLQVDTSADGEAWVSSRIQLPVPRPSTTAFEIRADGPAVFAAGPRGIFVATTVSLQFDIDGFANTLVGPDEDIHVEIVDFDPDTGVMTVRFLDENNDMEQIGDPREVDLETAGFSDALTNLIDVMEADPNWEPQLPGLLTQLQDGSPAGATASVGFAWFSTDGASWQRVATSGPLDGGTFTAVLATADGFLAAASNDENPSLDSGFDNGVVWESSDGVSWTEATGLVNISDGLVSGIELPLVLDLWDGEPVLRVPAAGRADEPQVWTLADPPQRVFPDIPTRGMTIQVGGLGLIGTSAFPWEEPEAEIEMLLSVDGTSWNRWEPSEFSDGGASEAWIVGVGDDFVVVQVWSDESPSFYSIWVGTLP